MSQNIIHTAMSVRQIALHEIQATPEALFDVQPQAFNNTIRWNVGHIVYWFDFIQSLIFAQESRIPDSYAGMFNTGTKPADWSTTPPTKDELVNLLAAQLDSLSSITPGSLEEPLKAPLEMGPLRFTTAGELFNFGVSHEAMHLGTMSGMRKVLKHEKL